jgi:glutaredoxin
VTANVTLYTRARCALCEKAKAAILASGIAVTITEVDIDGDPLLHDLYDDQVPVIFVNGREAFRYFVHPEEFVEFVRAIG